MPQLDVGCQACVITRIAPYVLLHLRPLAAKQSIVPLDAGTHISAEIIQDHVPSVVQQQNPMLPNHVLLNATGFFCDNVRIGGPSTTHTVLNVSGNFSLPLVSAGNFALGCAGLPMAEHEGLGLL